MDYWESFACQIQCEEFYNVPSSKRLVTSPFQGEDAGSNPAGMTRCNTQYDNGF